MFIRHIPTLQVGLWCRGETIDAAWIDPQNQPHFLRLGELELMELTSHLNRRFNHPRKKLAYKFITAIMSHQIWQKTLILPHNLNLQECEQQCHFSLTNELPIPTEEVWYDYAATPLKQGFRLDIFAIRQQIATEYLQQLMPLQIDVLDNAAKAMLRAAEYFLGHALPNNAVFLYQDETGLLAVQHKLQQTQTLFQTQGNLTALLAQYCQRYAEEPMQVFYYQTEKDAQAIPQSWHAIETELPFIALGNALWQRETPLKSTALFDADHNI
ncbi:competence protein ComA [Aggregatibacter actinomycetemcomitans]|uniref:competence protein ComA n=1 Tax=Aggregatibacter actinomycetemcomitans TaxID=714 RepID=UPI0011DC6D71|nr:competence protein ComA [Aggregatibacter actinomycetemcomitans]TYB00912.1 competence protein ComA [Aggregatibacter actinomycetemcomitans]